MIWAFSNFTGNSNSTTDDGMQYHGTQKGLFTNEIYSDGSVISGGDNGLSPTPSNATLVLKTSNGSTLSTSYNNSTNLIQFNAHVKTGSYLAVGFGTSMTNADMVAWEAGANPEASICQDLYSTGETRPILDSNNEYTTQSILQPEAGFIDFVVFRAPAPGYTEGQITYNVTLGQQMNMIWSFGQFTGNAAGTDNGIQYHGTDRSSWTMTINSDGTAESGGNNGLLVPVATTVVL